MPKVPYALVVGSLMNDMLCTRPEIAHGVGLDSRYMSHLGTKHWSAIKWILRYLRGTYSKYLYFGVYTTNLHGYVDPDLARDIDTRWSTTSYVLTIGGH